MLIDVNKACEELSIKPSTLYHYVEMGLVPVVKIGKLLRFDKDELLDWFKSGAFQKGKERKLREREL